MIEVFIKEGLPMVTDDLLEEFAEDWLHMPDTESKDQVFPYIIQEKLNRYEKEYE